MSLKALIRSESSAISDFDQIFCELPFQIRSASEQVGLPPATWTRVFLNTPLPYKSEFFILTDGIQAKARLSCNLSGIDPSIGYIGFFEAEDQSSAHKILDAAISWFKKMNVTKIRGPINFNTWLPYRFRTNWEDSHVFSWEPQNPQAYPEYWKSYGFKIDANYTSTGFEGLSELYAGTQLAYDKATNLGYKFVPFNNDDLLQQIDKIHAVTMKAFQQNYLFEPLPFEYFQKFYVPLAQKEDHSHSRFMFNSQNELVGYLFNFIDGDYFIMKSFAVIPEETGKGLSNACLHACLERPLKMGITKTVSALVSAGNRSESYGKKQTQLWQHCYSLFELETSDGN